MTSAYINPFDDLPATEPVKQQQQQQSQEQRQPHSPQQQHQNRRSSAPPRVLPDETKLLWTSIARATLQSGDDDGKDGAAPLILAEAGDDPFGGAVAQTARELLNKKATAGWEYHTQRQQSSRTGPFWHKKKIPEPQTPNAVRLKGLKFHLYDNSNAALDQNNGDMLLWVFSVVYNPTMIDQNTVKAFVEKMILLTELYRDTDETWRTGGTLSCQASFAPVLLQRMLELSYHPASYDCTNQMARLQDDLATTRAAMHDNIQKLLEREDRLHRLHERTTHLQDMAHDFKRRSKHVRQQMMWQNAKHGLLLGSAVTAGVAIVVVPPLVALL